MFANLLGVFSPANKAFHLMTIAFAGVLGAVCLSFAGTFLLDNAAFASQTSDISSAEIVSLSSADDSVNVPFSVDNMMPGDEYTKDFTVPVRHSKTVILNYHADIRPGYDKLAEVMNIRIEVPSYNKTLYDGLMRDMPNSVAWELPAEVKEVPYRITAYLDKHAGNEYRNNELVADFRWWYLEEDDQKDEASVKIVAEKELDGKYASERNFTFVLADGNNKKIQEVNNDGGFIEFNTLYFSSPGTYEYTLTEESGSNNLISYDPVQYNVKVIVDEEDGKLSANTDYECDGEPYTAIPRFINSTKSSPDAPNKTADHKNPSSLEKIKTGDHFNFLMYAIPAVVAVLIMIFLFVSRRREKPRKESER